MARTDYLDDPNRPDATSIVIAASAFVTDDAGRILMIRRTDNGLHSMPGGRHELGETMSATAVRETAEETGIAIEVTGLVGIYSNPNHVIAYDDGEVRQEFSICFRARPIGGALRESDESSEVRWVPPEELPGLDLHPSIRLRIDHALSGRAEPFYT